MTRPNTEADFWAKVDMTGDCWLWTGKPADGGYGQFRMNGVHRRTHRWAWLFAHGAEPVHQVNHSCGVPLCVNPSHLYDGTQSQNISDAVQHGTHAQTRKTHCPQGHPYDDENTYIEGHGRKCRKCHNEKQRKKYHRKMQDPAFREAERLRAEKKNRLRGYKPRR